MSEERADNPGTQRATRGRAVKRRGLIAGAALFSASVLARSARDAGASGPAFTLNNNDTTTNVGTTVTKLVAGSTYNGTLLSVDGTTATSGFGVAGIDARGFNGGLGINAVGGANAAAAMQATGGTNGGTGVIGVGAGAGVPGGGLGPRGNGLYAVGGSNGKTGLLSVGGANGSGFQAGIGIIGLAGGETSISGFTTPVGVFGQSFTASDGIGVYGLGSAGMFGAGVRGDGTTGVFGNNTIGLGFGVAGFGTTGVAGTGQAVGAQGNIMNSRANTIAVYGLNQGTGSNPTGVYGLSNGGTGVFGQTNATSQYGVLGTTTAVSSTAIAGIANTNGSSAFSGGTTNASAFAGVFQGTVVIQGKLVVSDPSYKSGALQHPDGSTRLVYCIESPESWIEDVGTGTLTNGTASVKFDPDFAAVTHTDTYHVFLTEYGGNNALYVDKRSGSGFEVHSDKPGASSSFSWKVMVKAKSTVKSERLGKFTMPNLPLPDVSKYKAPGMPTPAVPRKP